MKNCYKSCIFISLAFIWIPLVSLAADVELLTNPGFENGTTGWEGRECTLAVSYFLPQSGVRCGRSTNRTEKWMGIKQSVLGKMINGQNYTISGWVRISTYSDNVILSVEQADDSGIHYINIAASQATNLGWIRLTGTFTLNAVGTLTTLDIYIEGAAPGVDIYWDNVSVFGPGGAEVTDDTDDDITETDGDIIETDDDNTETDDDDAIEIDDGAADNDDDTSNYSSTDVHAYFNEIFGITLENIYWGEFHVHTSYSLLSVTFSAGQRLFNPRQAYAYARDVQKFDFIALNDNAEMPNLTAIPLDQAGMSMWQSLLAINLEYNNEDSSRGKPFIVFPGYEYSNTYGSNDLMGSQSGYGHKNVIFKEINPSALPQNRVSAWTLLNPNPLLYYAETATDLWARLDQYRPSSNNAEGSALTIIHTPSMISEAESLSEYGGPQDHRTDWSVMDPDFTRHVEICSQWGSSEGRVVQFDPNEYPEEYYQYTPGPQDALSVRNILYEKWVQAGDETYLLGFIGGTDDHSGKPGSFEPTGNELKYQGTVTGIVAPNLSREALWGALWNKHTLACSTSPSATRYPIILAAETGGRHLMMGDMGNHSGTIRLRALVSEELGDIELIIDGRISENIGNGGIDKIITLSPGRHFIYVRGAFYENGEKGMAWSSPIYFR